MLLIPLLRNVLNKIDEEKMPDYGHSKGYGLLPNFCPETDPLEDKGANALSKEERVAKEAKERAKRAKDSKVEYIMLQKEVNANKIDYKNREKYDVQLLKKSQEFTYKLFDQDRFVSIVKRAKQRIALGTAGEEEGSSGNGQNGLNNGSVKVQ